MLMYTKAVCVLDFYDIVVTSYYKLDGLKKEKFLQLDI